MISEKMPKDEFQKGASASQWPVFSQGVLRDRIQISVVSCKLGK